MQGKTRIAIGMVLLFASGIAIGFFGSGLVLRRQVQKFVGRGPAGMPARLAQRALQDIDLSDEQREQIRAILDQSEPRLRRMAQDCRETIRQAADEQFERIGAVLGTEQREEFEQRLEEIHRNYEKMREGHRRRPAGRRGYPQHETSPHGSPPALEPDQ